MKTDIIETQIIGNDKNNMWLWAGGRTFAQCDSNKQK
jgi:hypothetical protein